MSQVRIDAITVRRSRFTTGCYEYIALRSSKQQRTAFGSPADPRESGRTHSRVPASPLRPTVRL